jgi:NADH-quinone oxidoreductase subunit A
VAAAANGSSARRAGPPPLVSKLALVTSFTSWEGRLRPRTLNLIQEARLPQQYYPVLLTMGVAIVLGAAILLASHGLAKLVGNQTGGRAKLTTYESGMPLLDRSHKRISIAFFLVAIDFIVFDLEAAFLYPWALILRRGGWPLFAAVMVFVFLILVGFAYLWLKGGLDLGPVRETRRARGRLAYAGAGER